MAATLPPAGWYTDPTDSTQRRYWDGHAWTALTGPARPQDRSSESKQTREKSSQSKQPWIKTVADWFNTGTAAVKFAKALLGLLAFLGIITIGRVIIIPPGPPNIPVANLSSALLQPCDLGACGAVGWSLTQIPPSSPSSCPSFSQKPEGEVSTALSDGSTGIIIYEQVLKLAHPDQAISAYAGTAQNCSFNNSSGNLVTYQTDDSAGSYGDESAVFTLGVTNPGFQNETPTIGAYEALIARGDVLASVHILPGTEGTISQAMLNQIFTTAARLL